MNQQTIMLLSTDVHSQLSSGLNTWKTKKKGEQCKKLYCTSFGWGYNGSLCSTIHILVVQIIQYNCIYTHVISNSKELVPIRRYDQSCVTEQSGMAYSSGLRNQSQQRSAMSSHDKSIRWDTVYAAALEQEIKSNRTSTTTQKRDTKLEKRYIERRTDHRYGKADKKCQI